MLLFHVKALERNRLHGWWEETIKLAARPTMHQKSSTCNKRQQEKATRLLQFSYTLIKASTMAFCCTSNPLQTQQRSEGGRGLCLFLPVSLGQSRIWHQTFPSNWSTSTISILTSLFDDNTSTRSVRLIRSRKKEQSSLFVLFQSTWLGRYMSLEFSPIIVSQNQNIVGFNQLHISMTRTHVFPT